MKPKVRLRITFEIVETSENGFEYVNHLTTVEFRNLKTLREKLLRTTEK